MGPVADNNMAATTSDTFIAGGITIVNQLAQKAKRLVPTSALPFALFDRHRARGLVQVHPVRLGVKQARLLPIRVPNVTQSVFASLRIVADSVHLKERQVAFPPNLEPFANQSWAQACLL